MARPSDSAGIGAGPAVTRRETALLIGFAGLLLVVSGGGPDFGRYEEWARVAAAHDFASVKTFTVSPLGVPVNMWAHGTGFVFASGHLLLSVLVDQRSSALVTGWLASLVVWSALLRVLWIVASGSRSLVLFGAGVAFVGTHAGYYSHTHASESLGMAGVFALTWLVFEAEEPHVSHFALAGVLAALLITIRSYLGLYAAAPLIVLTVRDWARHRSPARVGGAAFVVAVPVAVSMAQIAFVNRWMTGSLLRSPYTFGDQAFRSVDLTNPEILAVLIHPWHGWLVYHPLTILGFTALAYMAVRGASREERLFWISSGLVIAAHLYIQASYVVWWLGQRTFGSRGMAPSSIILVAALIMALAALRREHRQVYYFGVWGATAASIWSFLLLMKGWTNYYEYRSVLIGQVQTIRAVADPVVALALLGCFALVAYATTRAWQKSDVTDRLAGAIGWVLTSLALFYLLERAWRRQPSVVADLLRGGLVAAGAAMALYHLATLVQSRWSGRAGRGESVDWLPAVAAAALFVTMSVLFFGLAASVEGEIAAGRLPSRDYFFRNTFNLRDMKLACHEYRHATQERFLDERSAFRDFLIRQGGYDAAEITC